jgi:hypothetical protein
MREWDEKNEKNERRGHQACYDPHDLPGKLASQPLLQVALIQSEKSDHRALRSLNQQFAFIPASCYFYKHPYANCDLPQALPSCNLSHLLLSYQGVVLVTAHTRNTLCTAWNGPGRVAARVEVCVYMCVCAHVCVCARAYVCMCESVCVCVKVCAGTSGSKNTCVSVLGYMRGDRSGMVTRV